jgi:Ca-activated chloride channel homolog
MTRILTGFATLVIWALSCRAQEPAPASIRVNVQLVNAAFTVRDTSGRLVAGLTQDDFEVIDDGAPQKIAFFARSADLPLRLALIADMSGSQEHFLRRHERDLETFLSHVLTSRDRAFLLCFGNHLRLANDFTASSRDLIESIREFDRNAPFMRELGPPELRLLGTAFYDALYYAVIERLAGIDGGKRALIVFSDGEDNSSAHHMLDAIEAAQAENVTIFGIRYTETLRGRQTSRNKYGTSVMARIALETGGADFDADRTDMKRAFTSIGDELRNSYELAYHSSSPADGTFHKLVIRARKPGLTVRARTGYFARVTGG